MYVFMISLNFTVHVLKLCRNYKLANYIYYAVCMDDKKIKGTVYQILCQAINLKLYSTIYSIL